MKNRIFIVIVLIVSGLLTYSCKNNGEILHKNITGSAYELVVVISDDHWNGEPGKLIKESLGQFQVGLPQDEPMFTLVKVPKEAFKDIFKSTRNILTTTISSAITDSQVIFKDDVWAYPQATVEIRAKNAEEFAKLYNENRNKIMSYFRAAEKERMTMNYNKYYEKGVYNVLERDFGVTMKVPPGFQIASQKENFIWYRYETPDISQGIILYTIPYVSDSTFTVDYLVSIRDSVLKANVPGPTEGSYPTTEKMFDQVFNVFRHNGNYASEMRGLWRTVNDFMGGPYISLAELDIENQRVVIAYGYVYAPSKDKRNFINQVEAMIYSLKLSNQEHNNELNRQMDDEINVEG
ncbi:MAG: DUF4837 family protein [Prolixibacteraceae bacterium]|nr:DUF4837 family protein [Prolixibacteraceae bacterium]